MNIALDVYSVYPFQDKTLISLPRLPSQCRLIHTLVLFAPLTACAVMSLTCLNLESSVKGIPQALSSLYKRRCKVAHAIRMSDC